MWSNTLLVILIIVVALLLIHERAKKDIEGPKELTDLFEPPIKQKRRKRFTQTFKQEVIAQVRVHGMDKTVQRYGYLGFTRQDIVRWMTAKK